MKENYQKILEKIIQSHQKKGECPRLLLHSCCAPCSSYVLEYLSAHFAITIFYYNPNIFPPEEFAFRAAEQQKLIQEMNLSSTVSFLLGDYDTNAFYAIAQGHEMDPEGGLRCHACFHLRLSKTAQQALAGHFDYFTTTLSISPHKDAQVLNTIGQTLATQYGIPYLYADFKKKEGYRRSCTLSQAFGLYRQDYCGCIYSQRETERRKTSSTPHSLPVSI